MHKTIFTIPFNRTTTATTTAKTKRLRHRLKDYDYDDDYNDDYNDDDEADEESWGTQTYSAQFPWSSQALRGHWAFLNYSWYFRHLVSPLLIYRMFHELDTEAYFIFLLLHYIFMKEKYREMEGCY